MSDWSGPTPIPQQYPGRPTDGIGQLVGLVKDQATRMREITSNLLRSMGVRARPGQMSSLDYDGTSHAALGTLGWALASDSGGPSYLALNGIDVYADLAAKTATLTAQQADLTSQLASINALIGQQTVGLSGSNNTGTAVAVGTSAASYAVVTFTVPSGFTKATVIGISSATAASGAVAVYVATRIAGTDGATTPVVAPTTGSASAGSGFSRDLTGLSGTFTVETRIYGSSSCSVYSVTSAMAIFSR